MNILPRDLSTFGNFWKLGEVFRTPKTP